MIVTINPSTEQVVAGFPKFVTLTVDSLAANIFYTLDGSTPDLSSDIYIDKLYIPYDKATLVLRAFATDGTTSSDIVTEIYKTNILNNTRLPHNGTTAVPGTSLEDLYPFGTQSPQPNTTFTSAATTSYNVNNPLLAQYGTAFDANGNVTTLSNKPYNIENYPVMYSTTDDEGRTGNGIGTLPGDVVFIQATPAPETTQQFSNTFDPRAQVVFQDFAKENPGDPTQVNSIYFSLENAETVRDGNAMTNVGAEGPSITGSFVKAHYNPKDNTITHYYYDNAAMRWIISKAPYVAEGTYDGNLTGASAFGRGSSKVFEWVPFQRRHLF